VDNSVAGTAQTLAGFAYSDINRLGAIKAQGPAGIRAAAQQFESMFIDMVMSSMREATNAFADGDYTSSDATRMQQEMLDHQWAIHIAEHGGVGLADIVVKQLGGVPAAKGTAAPAPSTGTSNAPIANAAPQLPAGFAVAPPDAIVGQSGGTSDADALTVTEMGTKDGAFDDPEDFVAKVLPVLKRALAGSGLNPLMALAQGALETGWGAHVIHTAAGDSTHNLFNIKASTDWPGPAADVATMEVRGGQAIQQRDRFRCYDSVEDAARDYASLLQGDQRYRRALDAARDPARFADELQKAGYATDPNYAAKILRVLTSGPLRAAAANFGG